MADVFITISLGNLLTYIGINAFNLDKLFTNRYQYFIILFFLLSILAIYIFLFIKDKKNKKSFANNYPIIPKRKMDLERISIYLNKVNILGINAIWGLGKSFIVNILKTEIHNEYEIIEIDILSCNLDELLTILITEIEKIMYRNKICSKYSKKLKSFISNDINFKKLFSFIYNENDSYSTTIKGFKEELELLDKKVLIIYEDIDRISDKNTIKKIFWISEKLSSNKIKFIYQYDENKLKELEFTSEYIEKYIPYKINLTKLTFFEIIEFLIDKDDIYKAVFTINDFDFFKNYKQKFRYDILKEKFDLNIDIYLNIEDITYSIRNVEHFIKEIETFIETDEYKQDKELVIAFTYIKYFYPNIYESLSSFSKLNESIVFNLGSKPYSIDELYYKYIKKEINESDIKTIFEDDTNKLNYSILKLLDYRDEVPILDFENIKDKKEAIETESLEILERKLHNQKKDKLIWNLLESGKSKDTNYEYIGKKFIKEVLSKNSEQQIDAYDEFLQDVYKLSNLEIRTIFRWGTSNFIELVKALRILDMSGEDEVKFFDFYIKYNKATNIEKDVIKTMNYFALKEKSSYINILKRINKLNVIGNLNSEECFAKFLKKYIEAISLHSYMNTFDYYGIDFISTVDDERDCVKKDLNKLIKNLKSLKESISKEVKIESIEDELDTIVLFARKMLELINCKNIAEDNSGFVVKTSISSSYINEEEFSRLKELKSTSQIEFKDELKKSYSQGNITVHEISKLLKEQ